MVRLIIVAILALSAFTGGLAIALSHWYGWKGLLAFPFIVLLLLWFGKIVIRKLFRRLALGLFSMKSRALRGATMQVHSIVAVPQPPKPPTTADGADAEPGSAGSGKEAEFEEAEDFAADPGDRKAAESEALEAEDETERKEYFAIDLTITPQQELDERANQTATRVWEPGELILTSAKVSDLEELEAKEVGTTEEVLVWGGSAF